MKAKSTGKNGKKANRGIGGKKKKSGSLELKSLMIKQDVADENQVPALCEFGVGKSKANLRTSVRLTRKPLHHVRNCVTCDHSESRQKDAKLKKLPVVAIKREPELEEQAAASLQINRNDQIVEAIEDEDDDEPLKLISLSETNAKPREFSVLLTPVENSLNRGARKRLQKLNSIRITDRTFSRALIPFEVSLLPSSNDSGTLLRVENSQVVREELDDVRPVPRVAPSEISICDKCLKFYKRSSSLPNHLSNCKADEGVFALTVYSKANLKIYRIDGAEYQQFCYNLTQLAKIYVNCLSGRKHATLFHFYVLYVDSTFAGFFSKQKNWSKNNVGAIMVLPQVQRRGYGKLLVAVSYELSKRENNISTPERPFTPAGFRCYLSYWREVLSHHLSRSRSEILSVEEVSKATFLHPQDILTALKSLDPNNVLQGQQHIRNIYKGQENKYAKTESIFDARYLRRNPRRSTTP